MSWSEDDSQPVIVEGAYFVPERETQIAAVCAALDVHHLKAGHAILSALKA